MAGHPSRTPGPGLEDGIARVLEVGTWVSIVFLALGLGLMVLGGLSPYIGGPALDPAGLTAGLLAGRADAFVWVGLLAVVITPTARVVAAVLGYLRQGEREMAMISSGILVVIILSVILARLAEA